MAKIRIRKKDLKKIYGFICSIIAITIATLIVPDYIDNSDDTDVKYTDYPFSVSFVDVGQGDCQLISCEGYNILVDGGEAENSQKVLRYLEDNNIDKLDCYILSHPHSDHIGASENIIRSINCDKIFTTYFSEFNIPTTRLYESLLDCLYEASVEPVAVEAGDVFTFGNLEIEILAPFVESDDYNEMSIVFTATYKDTRVLFTGDTTTNVEKQMLNSDFSEDIDLIKVAHHGSSTSSSEEFIRATSPEIAVISCGFNNSYGHPHKEILNLFDKLEIEVHRTDIEGTIVYFGDGKNMNIEAIK